MAAREEEKNMAEAGWSDVVCGDGERRAQDRVGERICGGPGAAGTGNAARDSEGLNSANFLKGTIERHLYPGTVARDRRIYARIRIHTD